MKAVEGQRRQREVATSGRQQQLNLSNVITPLWGGEGGIETWLYNDGSSHLGDMFWDWKRLREPGTRSLSETFSGVSPSVGKVADVFTPAAAEW